ncbi:uncharacterized protein LOC111910664 [Lactuca sativa]|uniref:RRM domain-containing protein n=1 Tax=Lactuca sativa TaxID=4236 RepID=A0A9R1W268_LACSA|nr:uncharacterized protein LOC111910664 [Lactuca sativa]KAJ0217010.1 hypothetical protein LSAT_V11C300138190 [Lactuca sativa]
MAEDGWSKVCRRRQTNTGKRWDHRGVTTMFVSDIPDGVSKEKIRRLFEKFGEITDIYMATKKDVKRKNFAFVRFKKGKGEQEMELLMQGIKCNESVLTVNIARYERKRIPVHNVADTNKIRYAQQPLGHSLRDGRSFMEVAA